MCDGWDSSEKHTKKLHKSKGEHNKHLQQITKLLLRVRFYLFTASLYIAVQI